jgi:hypothetical protein
VAVSLTANQFALLVAASAVVAALCGTGLGLVVAALVRTLRQLRDSDTPSSFRS